MTTDADAMLAAVLDHPGDDTPRLVYADAIEEADPVRAEFVRVQVAFARLPPAPAVYGELPEEEHVRRGLEFFDLLGRQRRRFTYLNIQRWFRDPGPVFDRYTAERSEFDSLLEVSGATGINLAIVRRGFLSEVVYGGTDHLMFLGDLLARHPVEVIRVRPDGDEVLRVEIRSPVRPGGQWAAEITDAAGWVCECRWADRAKMVAKLPGVVAAELAR
jgi:uncharacterized protein (TIGR02996 family)